MDGLEDQGDEPEFVRPIPHADDRLWRHPAEIAAEIAAASAATVELPTVDVHGLPEVAGYLTQDEPNLRLPIAMAMAGTLMLATGAALLLGLLSSPSTSVVAAGSAVEALASTNQIQTIASSANTITAMPRVQAATSAGMREGSGFFITDDGHIATSASLISGADYVIIWTADGHRFNADVVASDHASDVAVIHIDNRVYRSAPLNPDATVSLGDATHVFDHTIGQLIDSHVVALATTSRLDGSPSSARISLAGTSTPIGSAIVNSDGHIIAMATALIDEALNEQLATPSWMIDRVARDLITDGTTAHTVLGVSTGGETNTAAVAITAVSPGSPAAVGGLKVGDLIASVNGTMIDESTSHNLWNVVSQNQPGDEVDLTITRSGQQQIVQVTLDSLDN